MGGLQKLPIVSLLVVVAMAVAPFLLADDPTREIARFEAAQEEARDYFVRHPALEVDALGELVLDSGWLAQAREAAAASASSLDIRLPPRMLARSQAQLDALIDDAYEARLHSDPAWRFGVLDAQSPTRNYFAHAFVHESMVGVMLAVVVLLLVGIPLERTWGSPVFAAFVAAAFPAAAQAYRVLDASSNVPWSGGAGLAGALLGAYFIRGLGGQFVLPGWVLLPTWLGLEALLVRGFWLDDLGSVPWATIAASIGLGALVSGGLRLLNVEQRVDAAGAKRKAQGPNPVVQRAARLRSDGDPYQAFDLIQAAWRDHPRDEEICEAFYSIAVEVGQPEVAADAILPMLRSALKRGDVKTAIDYWMPLASRECDIVLEATASVRLGEALLDAGHPEQALLSLRQALDAGVSSAHATRIVKIARDLDEGLTRRAASIALNETALDPKVRADLEALVAGPEPDPAMAAAEAAPDVTPQASSLSSLDRRVHAEHQVVDTTAFPLDLDADLEDVLDGDDLDEELVASVAAELDHEAALAAQALDAGALSAELLAAEDSHPDAGPEGSDAASPVDSGDVLSHWNDPGLRDDSAFDDVSAALDHEDIADELLEDDDLETSYEDFGSGLGLTKADLVDPRDDVTDTDLTPMMDATDELTSPLARPSADGMAATATPSSTGIFDQPTTFVGSDASAAMPDPSAQPDTTPVQSLRSIKALDAVPLEATAEWIEIDADGRGKSKLPYARIQAIAIAAVAGLGPRPVLVLDCVLNWMADAGEPMKSIRFRSDRFDPQRYVPSAASPLAALTAWLRDLESLSGATCLPTRQALEGSFERFASLEDYEREVLLARSDD